MNRPASSKFVPGLLADDDIDTQTNSSNDNSIKIYDGVADCPVNDSDTFKNVKIRAKDLAIQKVQQKIADCVYGFWKDRYLTLPDDEVLSIASEICNITDVKYNFIDSDDNTLIRATVLAKIDDNDVMNYIIQFFKERNEIKIQNEALRKEIEDLKRQIITKDKVVLANQKYNEANKFFSTKVYISALTLCIAAINLNPYAYYLYEVSGDCRKALEKYKEAIQDYSKAIELMPNDDLLYKKRGECYQALGSKANNAKAKADFKKAEELSKKG